LSVWRASRPLLACLACCAAGAWPGPSATGQPIFAREDSLPVYVVPETTRVVAARVGLAEIIRKAQEGERRKFDGISTLAFNRTLKLTLSYAGRKPEKRCLETSARVYYRSPDRWTEAPLRESRYIVEPDGTRKPWTDEDDDGVRIGVDDGDETGLWLENLPAFLEDTEKFSFRILHRSLQRDQVLYEIGFKPRSEFDLLPAGRVWILTGRYQIVREEYEMENLPVPWLLKSVDLLTREWQEVDGRWLPRRVTARVELHTRVGLGLVRIPNAAEVVVLFDEYRLDPELDPALFESGGK